MKLLNMCEISGPGRAVVCLLRAVFTFSPFSPPPLVYFFVFTNSIIFFLMQLYNATVCTHVFSFCFYACVCRNYFTTLYRFNEVRYFFLFVSHFPYYMYRTFFFRFFVSVFFCSKIYIYKSTKECGTHTTHVRYYSRASPPA